MLAAGIEVKLNELKEMFKEAACMIDRIYVHWTAGWDNQLYNDYHICINQEGAIYAMTSDMTDCLAHTWHRNSRSIGISMTCCGDAACYGSGAEQCDLGSEPPTAKQIETLAEVCAVACKNLNLPVGAVMTHAEIAAIDGYGIGSGDPETRWDCLYLPDYYGANGDLVRGGDLIRGKAAFYMRKAV